MLLQLSSTPKNVTYLNDGEIAYINDGKLTIKTIGNIEMTPAIHKLEMNLEAIEKGGYEHFMIKEIFEQPKSIHDSLRGRFNTETATLAMRSLKEYEHKIKNLNRIIIIGCGTSWHAGLVGEYLFEDIARIPVEVEYASEFRYRNPVINENDLVIANFSIRRNGRYTSRHSIGKREKELLSSDYVTWLALPFRALRMQVLIHTQVLKLV
jgi:glucosamine--fructose-6-phosphate aminotransferase (isomerizing)